jgi:tRNA(Ser,Leu) C12 N-acetylase TAN1
MEDWNVVVTANEGGFRQACELLQPFGRVTATSYFNVLTLRVDDADAFLDELERRLADAPDARASLARVMPVNRIFSFQSPQEFEAKAAAAIEPWLDRFAGRRFHVRLHRRGFKGRMTSPAEERFLDRYIIGRLRERGADAEVSFDDPDLILAVETVDQRAGLALWTRDDLRDHPLLKLN